jgi:enoyl-[acyl-carrier protein] reductase II
MAAAMALGAEGVQIGSLFAASEESSAHPGFKNLITTLREGDTRLLLKKIAPVRLIRNPFSDRISEAEAGGATKEMLLELLGKGRAKK